MSSYALSNTGTLTTISASVGDGGTAACWIDIAPNQRVAYTTNAHSNTISSYSIAMNGSLRLLKAISTSTDSTPTSMTMSSDGRYLYVLDSGAAEIQSFSANADGTLTPVQTIIGLAPGEDGLAGL